MQHLQWFPGHMTAAVRMMEENLKFVDGVILILDARAPFSSVNPNLDSLFTNKKVLYVLNKSDLVESLDVKKAVLEFKNQGKVAVSISSKDNRGVAFLYDKILELFKDKIEKQKTKGIKIPIRIMVAGIPNTGKSTVINALFGGKKAITGDKAGVTKGKQWVKLKDLELLDTPGTMPPSFCDQEKAKHLAYIGSMNDDIIDFNDLAYEFIAELDVKYPNLLQQKYGINDVTKPVFEQMNDICVKRGFIKKGNEYDYDRCSIAIIEDFRKGRLGKIYLD